MSRAFLFVLDSFGVGGAGDAAHFGDAGSNTFGHIVEACAAGLGDREGLRRGPLDLPAMMSLGLGHAAAAAGYAQAYNVLEGFQGDKDAQGHRDTVGGWRAAGLPWYQS